jgi:hypothetical protein
MPGFLETQVANLLEKVLGPFVIGLDKQSLNLSVWSGEVLLRDLQLRTEALDALPIPVKAIGGTLGEVRVTVPWRKLGKEPLLISIDRVFLLVGPKAATDGYSEAEEKEKAERTKRDALEAWEAVQDNKEQSEKMGTKLVEHLTSLLLGQLQISITNVHVRIEGSNEGAVLAGGVVLRALKLTGLATLAGEGLQARVRDSAAAVRKCVSIEGASVYFSSDDALIGPEIASEIATPLDATRRADASPSPTPPPHARTLARSHARTLARSHARTLARSHARTLTLFTPLSHAHPLPSPSPTTLPLTHHPHPHPRPHPRPHPHPHQVGRADDAHGARAAAAIARARATECRASA